MRELVVPRILWAAIFASTVLFFVIQLVLRQPGAVEPFFAMALGGAAAMAALASLVIPDAAYRAGLQKLKVESREEDDPNGMPGVTRRRVAANPADAVRGAVRLYQTALILGLSLAEAVALFGFVLGFLGAPIEWVVPFFGVGWLLIASRFPTMERVIVPAERATGIVFRGGKTGPRPPS